MEVEGAKIVHSGSEGASLGNLVESRMALGGESAETKEGVSDKRAAEGGLFAAPEPNSKRQRQSRYIVVDGHAVLRDNNYGIQQGFISVYDGAEFQTGEGKADSEAIRANEKSDDFYINAAGEVVNVATAAIKAAKPKKERKPRELKPKDSAAMAHRAALKEDQEMSEVKRLVFVGKHMSYFQIFLTSGYIKRAQDALAELLSGKPSTSSAATGGVDEIKGEIDTDTGMVVDGAAPPAASADAATEALRTKNRTEALAQVKAPIKQFRPNEQPGCVGGAVELRDYQVEGVNFMLRMYHAGMSCVLADEMGLGKTLQTISFLGTLKADLKLPGPHLVVVPMSVLSNWMSEFKRFCPLLNVIRYHASDLSEKQRIRAEVLNGIPTGKIDVVVTTYEMVVSEGKNTGILSARYRMLVLDEAHKVKNDATQVSNACRRITKESCVFLTGTPVQNNLKECWSLLNCMQPDVFSKSDLFDDAFDPNDMTTTNMDMVDKVHKVLQLLVLRRKKNQVNLALPSKKEFRLLCPLSKMQQFWYKRILLMNAHMLLTGTTGAGTEQEAATVATAGAGPPETTTAAAASSSSSSSSSGSSSSSSGEEAAGPKKKGRGRPPTKKGAEGTSDGAGSGGSGGGGMPSTFKLSNLMMQLRKISNHPFLLPGVERTDKESRAVDLSSSSGKLKMLDRLLQNLREEGHRAVIFSQFTSMLDIIEDFIAMKGYSYVRLDGGTNRIQRMINIGRYNTPNSTLFLFLLSTRAGGLGVNLQTADTCILYDSDWNPQSDIQAMGRVHRIGQKKPVTIYRMVSAGTVEERIVARATRKLLLDEMISKGSNEMMKESTSTSAGALPGAEGDQDEEVHASEMVKALKFTMMRMFRTQGGTTINMLDDAEGDAMSNRAMDAAILRARGIDPNTFQAISTTGNGGGLLAGTSTTADEDEEEEEESANFDSKMFSLTSEDCKTKQFGGEDFSLASVYKGRSLKDIRNEWNDKQAVVNKKRDKGSRVVEVDGGKGVGKVKILKENMYDLKDGEPGIAKELKQPAGAAAGGASAAKAPAKIRIGGRARPGIDYQNLKYCQACGEYGSVVNCEGCPMSYHVQCLGFSNITAFRNHHSRSGPAGKAFFCTHHTCNGCKKNTAQAGNLLLRCLGCPLAFCEDCADWEGQMAIVPEQPPHILRKYGFLQCNQAVYVYCTPQCQQVSHETDQAVLGKNHSAVRAVEERKRMDADLERAIREGKDPALLKQQERARKAAAQRANQNMLGVVDNPYAKPKPRSYSKSPPGQGQGQGQGKAKGGGAAPKMTTVGYPPQQMKALAPAPVAMAVPGMTQNPTLSTAPARVPVPAPMTVPVAGRPAAVVVPVNAAVNSYPAKALTAAAAPVPMSMPMPVPAPTAAPVSGQVPMTVATGPPAAPGPAQAPAANSAM